MRKSLPAYARPSPARLLVLLLASIVLAQVLAVGLLHAAVRTADHGWAHELLELALFTLLCGPLLWFAVIRPLHDGQRREQLKAQAILDNAAEGIVTIDERGRILGFNPAAERIFGYSAAEMLGENVNRLMPSPDRERHDAYIRNYLATGRTGVVGAVNTFTGRRKDGTDFPLELAVGEVATDEGRLFTGIVHDVSRHLAVEAALARSNALLERIFANLHTLVAYLDADFNFIRVNRAYAEADGREPDFFTGKNHFALYPDAGNEAIFRRVVETGEPYAAHARAFEHPDHPERGVTHWDWGLYPIRDAGGKVDGLLLSLVDVTERERAQIRQREAEAARHLSEGAAKALLNATPESALLLDREGRVLAANEVGARRFGSTPEALVGRNVFDLMPAEVAARRRSHLDAVIRTGQPITFEDEREGMQFETSVYPILGSDGQVASLAVYAADVTGEKQREAVERLLQGIDQMAVAGLGMDAMLDRVCERMVQGFGLALAWAGEKQPDGTLRILASRGAALDYLAEKGRPGLRWDGMPDDCDLSGAAVRTGKVQATKTSDSPFRRWRTLAARHGVEAAMSLPIVLRGDVYGALTLYSTRAGAFEDTAAIRRFEGILGRIGVALEMALEQQEVRLLGGALAAASNAVFIADRKGRIEWANEAFCRLTGHGLDEVLGQNPRFLKSGLQEPEYYKGLWDTILAGQPWSSETVERHKDGHLYTVRQTITPIRDAGGEISHFITIHEDITAQKAAEARIHRMAHYDALTDLPNRALFYDRLQQAMSLARRNDDQVALLFLDLDRFKEVNDSLGHALGDLLLKAVAERLRACVRESDTVARLAGDEFTVILPEVQRHEDAALVGEKIVRTLAEPFDLEGHEVRIGTSIGIALYAGGKESVDDLVRQADAAMYVAKTESRNTYRFAAPAATGARKH